MWWCVMGDEDVWWGVGGIGYVCGVKCGWCGWCGWRWLEVVGVVRGGVEGDVSER